MAKKTTPKKDYELVPTVNSCTEMTLNAKVNMDDIVSIFASKYEEALYKDAEISRTGIKGLREDLDELQKESIVSVDGSKMIAKHPLFSSVKEVSRKLLTDSVVITFALLNVEGRQITAIDKKFPLLKKFTNKRDKLSKELCTMEQNLTQTLQKIRDIGRKERQIRARIIERKLENSGLSDLLQDEEMQNLIGLDV